MAAGQFTLLASSPYMLRYQITSTDGALGERTASQLMAECVKGSPLFRALYQIDLAGSWGANSAPFATPNPATNPKISVTLASNISASGTVVAGAAYRWYNNGSVNVIGVLGGDQERLTVIQGWTDCILEIRYNHSNER